MEIQTTMQTMRAHGDWMTTTRQMWLWPVSILVGFQWRLCRKRGRERSRIGGNGDSRRAHRRRDHRSRRMVCLAPVGLLALDPGDDCGDGHGLATGAALVDYGISRGDLALMGA